MKRILAIAGAMSGVALIVLIDLVLAANAGGGSFVDGFRAFLRWGGLAPFALGTLMGHWFHPGSYDTSLLGSPTGIIVLIVSALLVVGVILGLFYGLGIVTPPLIPLALGLVAGAVLWPV